MSDLEAARRSTGDMRESWKRIPRAERYGLGEAGELGFRLSQQIGELRQARAMIESSSERLLEEVDVHSKESAASLEQLRRVVLDHAEGRSDPVAARKAVNEAERAWGRVGEWLRLAGPRTARAKRIPVSPMSQEIVATDTPLIVTVGTLAAEWYRQPALGGRWPNGMVLVNEVTDRLASLEEAAAARGLLPSGTLPLPVEESVTLYDQVLKRLVAAVRRHGTDPAAEQEIDELMGEVEDLGHRVDALLRGYAPLSDDRGGSEGRTG